MILDIVNSPSMVNCFLRDSHHANLSILFSTQILYVSSKHGVTITRNCSELCIFNSKSDQQILSTLGNNKVIYSYIKICNSSFHCFQVGNSSPVILAFCSPFSNGFSRTMHWPT
jgi:hypothetical protein